MTPTKGSHVSPVAERLRNVVSQRPGIHFRALGRAAEVSSVGQLRHHIDRLTREGRLVEVEDGRYKRFFLANQPNPRLRPALTRFARRIPRRIGTLLLMRPMNRTELRRALGCADSTLGFHLTRMLEHGDLIKHREANRCEYELTDQDLVRDVLRVHTEAARNRPEPLPAGVAAPADLDRSRPATEPAWLDLDAHA